MVGAAERVADYRRWSKEDAAFWIARLAGADNDALPAKPVMPVEWPTENDFKLVNGEEPDDDAE